MIKNIEYKIQTLFELEAIGFPGFYESPLLNSDQIENSIEDGLGIEGLSEDEKDEIYASIDFNSYEEKMSNIYMSSYIDFLNEVSPGLININTDTNIELHSPSSYNYGQDHISIAVSIDESKLMDIHRSCLSDPSFANFLKDNFSDNIGFWSFYSNQKEDWEALENLDPIQINYLLYFHATTKSIENKLGSLNLICLEDCLESGVEPIAYAEDETVERIRSVHSRSGESPQIAIEARFKSDFIDELFNGFKPFGGKYGFIERLEAIAKEELKKPGRDSLYKTYIEKVCFSGCIEDNESPLIATYDCEQLMVEHLDDYLRYLSEVGDQMGYSALEKVLRDGATSLVQSVYEDYIYELSDHTYKLLNEKLFRNVFKKWDKDDSIELIAHLSGHSVSNSFLPLSIEEEEMLLGVFNKTVLNALDERQKGLAVKYITETTSNPLVIKVINDYVKGQKLSFDFSESVSSNFQKSITTTPKRGRSI